MGLTTSSGSISPDELYTIAVWEKLLEKAQESPGIVIDLRENGGGSVALLYALMSYLFPADDPAQLSWFDAYVYDDQTGDLVKQFSTEQTLSSLKPNLTYTGPVVVLVNESSASAAEYTPQFLQTQGRAIVVGEHGTEGAGGYLEQIAMPGDFQFYYTKSRTYFAGTDELNLEAKGVTLDVRVPVTLENELAKQEGRDVVLEAALEALEEEAARLAAEDLRRATWQLVKINTFASGSAGLVETEIENPDRYTLTFGQESQLSIQADCNQAGGNFTLSGQNIVIEVGPATLAACPEGSQSETFLTLLPGEKQLQIVEQDGKRILFLSDATETGDSSILQFEAVERALSSADAGADDMEAATGELPAELVAQLDAFLASQVYSEGGVPKGAAPGLVLLVDTPDGRYLEAAGVSSLEEGTPIKEDDILQIGSNTKSMLIVLLLQLQEEGELSMDDLLSDWLPEQAAVIPNAEQVTLRQLANMTTGFWDYADNIIGEGTEDPGKLELGYTPEELIQYAVENGTPDFLPGEGWKYSNTNYILLGMIAEKAGGQSLGELFQERIFDPLGMETAVLIEGVPQEGEITTQGYYWKDDGTILDATRWNASQGWAAGANAMEAEDLLTYAKALAAGDLFQNPDSLAEMLDFNDAALSSLGASYGLGLAAVGRGYWGHEGATVGFQSLWYTNPEKGITVVGLTNSGTYKAWNLLNVINILEGEGLQPFQAGTLLPAANTNPFSFLSAWEWKQQVDPDGTTEIDAATNLIFFADGTAMVASESCGTATGTFSTDPDGQLSLDLDSSEVTCAGEEPLLQLIGMLDASASWRFENGSFVVVLDDGTELAFGPLG